LIEKDFLRLCTLEDFNRINAIDIWLEKFPSGENDGTLICDSQTSFNGSPLSYMNELPSPEYKNSFKGYLM